MAKITNSFENNCRTQNQSGGTYALQSPLSNLHSMNSNQLYAFLNPLYLEKQLTCSHSFQDHYTATIQKFNNMIFFAV